MKLNTLLAATVLAVSGMSCSEMETPDSLASTPTNVSAREVSNEARETADTARQFAFEKKDQFLTFAEAKLKECGQKIADFDAKLATLAFDYNAKAEGAKALDALREKRTQLGQQLEKLRQCSQEAWQETKAAVDSAAAEVDKAYENAKSKFKD